jgi:hypothetical protein
MENFYARQVRAAGDSGLLRQAFVNSFGHCNFSPAELVAGVLALGQRVATGRWGDVADPVSLNRVAASLHLGAAQFADHYYPGRLTGATGLERRPADRH